MFEAMADAASGQRVASEGRAPASVPQLQARGLSFQVGDKRLIDTVDVGIAEARCTVIMGANGTGKSLLLRLLHGLICPTGGEVLWQGRPMDRAARNAQAMVFQRPVLLRRSVLANLRFALAARGITGSARRDREQAALRQARLEDMATRPARVLSGGEQQRLAVARALSCEPRILFLDEPTASLDSASIHAVEELIGEARARGVTIVLVTHDIGQARRMGDDLVFMHGGRIAEAGPVGRVLDSPQSGAVQAWASGRLYLEP